MELNDLVSRIKEFFVSQSKRLFFVLVLLVCSVEVYAACVAHSSDSYICQFYTADELSARQLCISLVEPFEPPHFPSHYDDYSDAVCVLSDPVVNTEIFNYFVAGNVKKNAGDPYYLFQIFYPKDENYCQEGEEINIDTGECQYRKLPVKTPLCGVGNPCDPITGYKFQPERDIEGVMPLKRTYNSGYLSNTGFGIGWRSPYQKSLDIADNELYIVEGSGRGEPWSKHNNVWQGDVDSDYALTEETDGRFVLSLNKGGSETYSATGRLLSTFDAKGNEATYTYVDDKLSQVTNHYGKSISFTYTAGVISQVTDALGNVYHYDYDANNNLVSVTYPDETPANETDNPKRVYHYENTDYPNHLTGVTDENDERYSTFAYDAEGKAVLTEHAPTTNAVPQERFQLNYQD